MKHAPRRDTGGGVSTHHAGRGRIRSDTRTRRAGAWAAACGLALVVASFAQDAGSPAGGQPPGDAGVGVAPVPLPAGAPRTATRTDLRAFNARSVTRLAMLDLRACPGPLPRDFAIASELLALASRLAPDDADIVRRRAEAAWNAGDEGVLLESTRRVIELDPADTVAQLRLITARIGRLQTARARLEAYERFLDPRAGSLDDSVRSRLALDAALLRREMGDEDGFVDRLKTALRLDPTNKDAALLAFTFFTSRVDDRAGRLDLLSNLLLADPLDPRTVRMLRDESAAAGDFTSARRFHVMERAITLTAGRRTDDAFNIEGYVLDWLLDGPAGVAKSMNTQVESRRASVRFAAQMDPSRLEGPSVLRPEDVRLDIPYEQVRALTLHLLGEEERETLRSSLTDMALTTVDRINAYNDPTRRPPNVTPEMAEEASGAALAEMHMFVCLVGYHDAGQINELERLATELFKREGDPRAVAARAWRAVISGDDSVATAEYPESQRSLWLILARAKARERIGDMAGAAALYREAADAAPLNPLCAYARSRADTLAPDPARARLAAEVRTRMDAIPGWVDQMVTAPRLTMSLSVEMEPRSPAPIEPVVGRVRLRNVSPIPLGVGSARAINSRFFFGPSLETGIRTRSDLTAGEVFELDRRLRLRPGEVLEAVVWPDVGIIGWLQEVGSDTPSRVRWRVIQGFEARADGSRERGPGCLEVTTNTVLREALPESRMPVSRLAERLFAPAEDEAPALLVALRTRVMGGEPAAQAVEDYSPLIEHLATAYPNWPSGVRLLAATILPSASTHPSMLAMDRMIAADDDADVRLVHLVTRVTRADDPAIQRALDSGVPALAHVARAHRDRLAAGQSTIAHTGPVAAPVRRPVR